jgi:hypothetical protein
VLTATPLARREEGKISEGIAHGIGPLAKHDNPIMNKILDNGAKRKETYQLTPKTTM